MGGIPKHALLQRRHTMANTHMNICLTSLFIREMQIRTTVRYHLTLVWMAIIKKSTKNECCWGCGKKRTLLHCWCEYLFVQPLKRIVWRFLKKPKVELSHDPAIPFLGTCLGKTTIPKDAWTPVFMAALFTRARIWQKVKKNWRRQWQPTPVLLPGKSHGWRTLIGCSPWDR